MAEFPSLPLWTDAYLADCGHLTTIEHGAYLLLLMTMWRAGGKLPNDDKKLARFARLNSQQWQRIKPSLWDFFEVGDEFISQGRLTDELAFVKQNSAKQSNRARARWLKNKDSDNAAAMPNACRNDAPTPTPTPTPIKKESPRPPTEGSPPKPNGKLRKGTRLPEDWQPSEAEIAYARERGFDSAMIQDIASDFHTYWTAGNGRNKTHADWTRAWQTWVRKEKPSANQPAKHDAGGNRLGHGSLAAAARRNFV